VNYLAMNGRNVLYINNGDGTFTDPAPMSYGLGFSGYSTQAAFFDMTADGDLTCTCSTAPRSGALGQPKHEPDRAQPARRRPGSTATIAGISWTSVPPRTSTAAWEGLAWASRVSGRQSRRLSRHLHRQHFPENDFLSSTSATDLYRSIAQATGHTSRFSMGADAGGISHNDGRPDIARARHAADSERILKSAPHRELYAVQHEVAGGYHSQYARNTPS